MVKVNKEACVPLLPYDLGYEETILQLIKSLDCLDRVVECVYGHVRGNINSQKSQIARLDGKLKDVAKKVHKLSNIKKSVQVYSSSKYPATHCQKDYEYSYDFDVKSDIVDGIQVDHQIYASSDASDKLKFYNVNDERFSKNKDVYQVKGLGGLPDDVKYVGSLLLFNSNENLYKNYVLSNPYKANTTPICKQIECVENTNKPVFTLPLDDTENQFNYSYTPVCEEVPSIDVPADLPDLPGIAGDVQCFEEKEIVDASVICKPSGVVDLPSFDELDDLRDDEAIAADDGPITNEQETVPLEPELSSTVVRSTQNKTGHIEDIQNPVGADESVNNKTYNDNVNTHSVLMDEIRNAGGLKKAKLRSVSDRKPTEVAAPTAGGLMADLHKKLAMRRQGISGNNKQNDGSLEGVIYRMASTMLPPSLGSESEPDVDEDTEGDWDD